MANQVGMVQSSPQNALQNQFMQTPAYQLQYGQNYSINPAERFQNDPGVQMAIQAGMQPLMASYAGRGLGQSGALAQGLSQYMYNNYNNYTGQQASLYNTYQNQLANLVNSGMAVNGATQANNNSNLLAQILSNANLSTASNQANAHTNAGNNISQLLANLGVSNASSILNTGAAQSNNLMQGAELLAQANAQQQASNAGTLSSYYNGMGAQAGQTYLNNMNNGVPSLATPNSTNYGQAYNNFVNPGMASIYNGMMY